MSVEFSPESLFVARNWDTVSDIIEAARRLGAEMQRMLASLEDHLLARPWWSDEWTFVVRDPGQAYISRRAWSSGEHHLLWIGVDRFRPASVFGLDDPPYLYVYVPGQRRGLRDALTATLREEDVLGELGKGGAWFIVAEQAVARCLPDQAEAYFPQAREQMLSFFDHYAALAPAWDAIVAEHVSP